jgi:hypothetical protein
MSLGGAADGHRPVAQNDCENRASRNSPRFAVALNRESESEFEVTSNTSISAMWTVTCTECAGDQFAKSVEAALSRTAMKEQKPSTGIGRSSSIR